MGVLSALHFVLIQETWESPCEESVIFSQFSIWDEKCLAKKAGLYPLYRAMQKLVSLFCKGWRKRNKKSENFTGILEKTKKKRPILLFHKNMLKYSSIFQKGEPL